MKMKGRIGLLLCTAVLLTALLCGCGSSAGSTSAAMQDTAAGESVGESGVSYGTMDSESKQTSAASGEKAPGSEAKRIDTAEFEMETTGFDDAVGGLNRLTDSCGGYFESSSVSSRGDGYRYAQFVIRVPAEKFQAFMNQAGRLCHVIHQSSSCEDVSETYYDTQGRLATQRTKLERLQALLAKADKMEDIITLENAISQTEEQIESLSGTLQHYDAQVENSTVTISLQEVYRLSNTEEAATGFAGRFGTAFTAGWSRFVGGLQSLLVALAYGWVWVLLLAAGAAVAVRTVRRRRRAHAASNGETGRKPSGPEGGGDK